MCVCVCVYRINTCTYILMCDLYADVPTHIQGYPGQCAGGGVATLPPY